MKQDSSSSELWAYLNGHLVRGRDAAISIYDRGVQWGDAVYDSIRTYNGKPFKMAERIDRFHRSSYYARINLELSPEELVRRARMQPTPRIPPHLVPTRQPGKWAERPETVESDLTPARLTKRSMRKTFPTDPPLPKMPPIPNIMQVNANPPNDSDIAATVA